MRRGSGFDEMGNVSSLGALKPPPIGSAAVFLDLVISCPSTARMLAPSVGLTLVMMKQKRNSCCIVTANIECWGASVVQQNVTAVDCDHTGKSRWSID